MTIIQDMPLEQIQKAADALKQRNPDLTALLSFYENIFQAQEAEKRQVHLDPIRLEDTALAQKRSNRTPLVAPSELRIDMSSCRRMLQYVCQLIKDSQNSMADTAKALGELVDQNGPFEALFDHLLKEDDAYFTNLAAQAKADKAAIAFIAYHSMRPSLMVGARQLSAYLDKKQDRNYQNCAVCGHLPGMAHLDAEGQRMLSCSFCGHAWPVRRVFCPFCSETDGNHLQYFYSELEGEYRIDVCDQCHRYLKTIDVRKTDRPIYLPLEQVASLHLDLIAQEKGYQCAVELSLDIS